MKRTAATTKRKENHKHNTVMVMFLGVSARKNSQTAFTLTSLGNNMICSFRYPKPLHIYRPHLAVSCGMWSRWPAFLTYILPGDLWPRCVAYMWVRKVRGPHQHDWLQPNSCVAFKKNISFQKVFLPQLHRFRKYFG